MAPTGSDFAVSKKYRHRLILKLSSMRFKGSGFRIQGLRRIQSQKDSVRLEVCGLRQKNIRHDVYELSISCFIFVFRLPPSAFRLPN
jgi:hypothetical protein